MIYNRKVYKNHESITLTIPSDLAKYLELEVGDEVVIQDDKGKHGKFISLWKKVE